MFRLFSNFFGAFALLSRAKASVIPRHIYLKTRFPRKLSFYFFKLIFFHHPITVEVLFVVDHWTFSEIFFRSTNDKQIFSFFITALYS